MVEPFADWVLGSVISNFRSDLVPDTHRHAFEADVATTHRLATSSAALLIMAVIAFSLPHVLASAAVRFVSDTTTWVTNLSGGEGLSAAGRWYTWVSIPLVQLLLLRWAWRIVLWWRLLWRTSRMPLTITPGHPDRMGGLEIVTYAPLAFVGVLSALSALAAAGSANAIALNQMRLVDLQAPIAAFVILELLVLLTPQLFFIPAAERARLGSLLGFASVGRATTQAFARNWTDNPTSDRAGEFLESAQASAMADYGATYAVVREMRPAGLSLRRTIRFALALLAPFTPLLLFEYSLRDILRQVAGLFG
jgi:hypothetical protein